MPLPIDVNSEQLAPPPLVESQAEIEHFIEAQSEVEPASYQAIAARRAQLECAETLRRVRAL